jgi:sugar O-acyltransferase (sialic acid O-acetyltransferase NeuD family)
MAGAVVNAFTKIGRGCIVNTGATIDHDCLLHDFVHISPGVHLAGDVRVSACSWIGIGASIKQGMSIGAKTTVAAGSVVISNIPADSIALGVPAKVK